MGKVYEGVDAEPIVSEIQLFKAGQLIRIGQGLNSFWTDLVVADFQLM